LDSDSATPTGAGLAEHDNHSVSGIDVLAVDNLVVRPCPKPVAKELIDSLVAVVDTRRRHLARGGVPDHVGIAMLAPRNAIACLKGRQESLDDLHVLARHRPRSISRYGGLSHRITGRAPFIGASSRAATLGRPPAMKGPPMPGFLRIVSAGGATALVLAACS